MKKISLILIVALILSSLCVTSFAASSNSMSDDMANTLIADLGIAVNFENMNDGITRAEFCSLVISAINMGKLSASHTLPFTDVTNAHPFYSAIYDAYALGLISSAELFNPDRIITLNEACKIAITAISYDFLAEANGGWPSGYIAAATSKDLLDGVSGDVFTRQNAYTVIYNTLGCPLPLMQFTDGEVCYKIDSGTTLLGSMWHITKLSGIFDAGQTFGLELIAGAGSGRAAINGNIVQSGAYNTDSFIGEYADAYVTDDGTLRSVYIYPQENTEVITISSTQNITLNNLTYTWEVSEDKTKSASFASDAILVVNGKKVAYDKNKLVPLHGSVKLIKYDGEYSLVVVESYREIVAGTVLVTDCFVSDVRDPANGYTCENPDGLSIYDVHDKSMGFGGVSKYSVLWVYESPEGERDKIIVCDDMISGELTGIASGQVEIDNMLYDITDSARAAMDNTMSVGTVLTCSINPDGEIVHVRLAGESSDVRVGYLIYGGLLGSGFNQKLSCQILGDDGNIRSFSFAPKAVVNGIGLGEEAAAQYSKYPKDPDDASSIRSGIVAFETNDDGQINKINYDDYSSAEFGGQHDVLFRTATIDGINNNYVTFKNTYSFISCPLRTRIFVQPETVQFIVPTITSRHLATDKNYQVKKINSYASQTGMEGFVHTGYTFDKGTMHSPYLTSVFDLSSGSNDTFDKRAYLSIVEDVSTIIGEDGMPVGKLKMWCAQSQSVELTSEQLDFFSRYDIQKGDLVKVEYNQNNVATDILVFHYDPQNGFTIEGSKDHHFVMHNALMSNHVYTDDDTHGMGTLSDSYVYAGKVYNVEGTKVRLVKGDTDPSAINDEAIADYQLSTIKLCKYNAKSGTVDFMEPSELRTYLDTASNCHTMVVETYSGNILSAYVIEYE